MLTRTTEWLNANSYRRYPFVDDAILPTIPIIGAPIPDDAVLDFQAVLLYPPYAAGPSKLIYFYARETETGFHFSVGGWPFVIMVPQHSVYPYVVHGSIQEVQYTVVFGPGCERLHDHDYAYPCDVELQPALTVVQDRHRVDTITAKGYDTLTGTVYVEPGYNCKPSVTADVIRLQAGLGHGAGKYCTAIGDDVLSCAAAWLRFNGQVASEDGNVMLQAGTGVEIVNAPDGAPNTIVIKGSAALENMKCG